MNRYNKFIFIVSWVILITGFTQCTIDDIPDPNNPDVTSIENNASLSEIQNLVDGILAGMRRENFTYFDDVSVIGREVYRFSGSDPRYTADLLGAANATLDPGGFYTVNPWAARYRVVKNCNILETATTNTKAAISAEEKKGIAGFLKTIKAHELLMNLNLQWTNGIRIDVKNSANLGPFLDLNGSLTGILQLLDEAKTDLQGSGASFIIKLNSGFNGFNTPAEFLKFNRALAARVQAYLKNWNGVLTALNESFYEPNTNLTRGVYYVFSKNGGDQLNEIFYPLNSSGEVRLAHPSFITDADPGDRRLSKVSKRTAPATSNGLTSEYDFALYPTNESPVFIIRNEELILLWAEAKIETGTSLEVLSALNVIRNAAGINDYSGSTDKNDLVDEMLKQRRYSLYGECHRWIDVRRYGKLASLPLDRAGDDVWPNFPRPNNE